MSVRDEYVKRMKAARINGEYDNADRILCDLLRRLGYGAVVEQYEAVRR